MLPMLPEELSSCPGGTVDGIGRARRSLSCARAICLAASSPGDGQAGPAGRRNVRRPPLRCRASSAASHAVRGFQPRSHRRSRSAPHRAALGRWRSQGSRAQPCPPASRLPGRLRPLRRRHGWPSWRCPDPRELRARPSRQRRPPARHRRAELPRKARATATTGGADGVNDLVPNGWLNAHGDRCLNARGD